MKNTLVLIANPKRPALDHTVVQRASELLWSNRGAVGTPNWLASGIACEIPFEGKAATLSFEGVDAVVLPSASRRKPSVRPHRYRRGRPRAARGPAAARAQRVFVDPHIAEEAIVAAFAEAQVDPDSDRARGAAERAAARKGAPAEQSTQRGGAGRDEDGDAEGATVLREARATEPERPAREGRAPR